MAVRLRRCNSRVYSFWACNFSLSCWSKVKVMVAFVIYRSATPLVFREPGYVSGGNGPWTALSCRSTLETISAEQLSVVDRYVVGVPRKCDEKSEKFLASQDFFLRGRVLLSSRRHVLHVRCQRSWKVTSHSENLCFYWPLGTKSE